ncbi:hypothetical protein Avbf_10404 [Armadillidium vulgare]|nr:hypothetical protein Avbf_10404 [Armadillidium vulgare]
MRKAGRQKESIWAEFDEIPTTQKTGIRVKCKTCGFAGISSKTEEPQSFKMQGIFTNTGWRVMKLKKNLFNLRFKKLLLSQHFQHLVIRTHLHSMSRKSPHS